MHQAAGSYFTFITSCSNSGLHIGFNFDFSFGSWGR